MPAQDLLRTVVKNELAADKSDESLWMYTSTSKKPSGEITQKVVQTWEGTLYKHVSINGQALSEDQENAERKHIQKMADQHDEPRKLKREQSQDADKAQQMLALLPDAVLCSYGQRRGDMVALNFKPNPKYHPTSREGQVFRAMAGTIWVNAKENRLAEIQGRLTKEVKFGGGVLGHLNEGGEFDVVQSEVQPGHWEISRLRVNMKGKALFFKSIAVQQDESRTDYRRMPDKLTLAQGAEMLLRGSSRPGH